MDFTRGVVKIHISERSSGCCRALKKQQKPTFHSCCQIKSRRACLSFPVLLCGLDLRSFKEKLQRVPVFISVDVDTRTAFRLSVLTLKLLTNPNTVRESGRLEHDEVISEVVAFCRSCVSSLQTAPVIFSFSLMLIISSHK